MDVLESVGDGLMLLLFLFQGYLLQYFCGSFLVSRFKRRQWNKVAVTVLYLLLRSVSWIWKPEDQTARTVIHLVLMFMITAAVVLGFYRASFKIALFLIMTFVAVSECSAMFAYALLHVSMKLSNIWVWFVEREYFLFEEFLVAVETTGIAVIAIYDAIIVGLMYVFLRKVNKNFCEKDHEIHQTELWFLLTPGVTGLLICLLLRIVIFSTESRTMELFYESRTLELFYDSYPLLVPVVPAIMLLCMMSISNRVKLFQDMIRLNREQNSRVILEKQIGSMQEHITEIERLYSGIRNIKHDMRNTLSIVMRLSSGSQIPRSKLTGHQACYAAKLKASHGHLGIRPSRHSPNIRASKSAWLIARGNERTEKGELDAYLTELNRTLDKLELHYRTGNPVADTLLNMKYHEILRVMPECRLDAEQLIFPAGLVIQSYDYGVILGNALDNAMEACKKLYDQGTREELFIRLSSFRRGNQFFIEVVNSFDGKILRGGKKEFPQTHKANKKSHGMGLYHVKSTAEKYYGAVEWSAMDKIFTLTVMMQNERRMENEL